MVTLTCLLPPGDRSRRSIIGGSTVITGAGTLVSNSAWIEIWYRSWMVEGTTVQV
jgi:hypothetical protein